MAETKNERKTFKWGDQEYLLDDLLKLHGEYEQNFYDFARERGQYDNEALQGLQRAITNRINAAKEGESFDGDGVLDTDEADNTKITTQKKGLFKKEKYVEQDNTAWAKHYLSRLMKHLKPYKASSGDWDITKHGLEAYLTGQGLDAKEIFEKYDLQDENNPDTPRSFTARHELLRNYLNGYKDWLAGKGFDFTKNDNEWDDNFITSLESLINNTDWNDSAKLASSLRKLGAGDRYTTAFTSDKWDLSKTNEEAKAASDKKKKEEEDKVRGERMKEAQDYFLEGYSQEKGQYYAPVNYSNHTFADGVTPNFMSYYADLNANERGKHGTYLGTDSNTWNNAYQTLMNSLRTGEKYTDKNAGIILQRYFEDARNGFTDLGNGSFLINESVGDKGQAYAYDPKSGYVQKIHLSDYANQNDAIRKVYEDMLYNYVNNKYNTNYHRRNYISFENGGILKAQLGAAVLSPYSVENDHKATADYHGNNAKIQKAKNKYISEDNKSELNPDAGELTALQKARIGYAALDLTSAISAFLPGAGTAVAAGTGLASTVGNFVSDLADEGVSAGEMWKNFGMNLGMDVLGLIPGGGAASKMGKIIKTLKPVVPTILALPGVASMLANSPEIAQSWKKAFDGDPESGGSKMTYQDYLNILQTLNVVTGATTIGRNIYKSGKRSVKAPDKIAVDVVDKQGNRKALVLEGKDVEAFNTANKEGKAQEFINNIQGGKDFTIVEVTTGNNGKFWGKDQNGEFHFFHQNPFGQTGTGRARVHDVRTEVVRDFWGRPVLDSSNNLQTRQYAQTGRWRADVMDDDLVNMSGRMTKQQAIDLARKRMKTQTELLTQKAKAHGEAKAKNDARIESVDRASERAKKIGDQYTAQEQKAQSIIDTSTSLRTELSDIVAQRNTLAVLQNQLASSGKKTKKTIRKKIAAKQEEINETQIRIDDLRTKLNQLTGSSIHTSSDAATAINTATATQARLAVQRARLQNMLNSLGTRKTNLEANYTTNSKEFDKLLNMKPRQITFNGEKITITPETTFTRDALLNQGLYKQGGSINRNKINKFINYGKR